MVQYYLEQLWQHYVKWINCAFWYYLDFFIFLHTSFVKKKRQYLYSIRNNSLSWFIKNIIQGIVLKVFAAFYRLKPFVKDFSLSPKTPDQLTYYMTLFDGQLKKQSIEKLLSKLIYWNIRRAEMATSQIFTWLHLCGLYEKLQSSFKIFFIF